MVYVITTLAPSDATPLTCSECGRGQYRTDGLGLFQCTADGCDHTIAWHDVEPECDEVVVVTSAGLLAVATDPDAD